MPLTRESLVEYLEQKMGVDPSELQDDTPLFSSHLLDSFSMVDLILFIEKSAEMKVGPGQVNLKNLDSVERILNFASAAVDAQ